LLELNKIYQGDVLKILKTFPDESVHCCVTSPPYWGLRDYGVEGQLGLESTPEEYVSKMVEVFREVNRVLRKDGTLWLNLGDSYAGSGKGAWSNKEVQKEIYVPDKDSPQCKLKKVPQGLKPKDLVGIPWMVAFALRADGWYLRQDIIWHKPNCMPESVKDRCTKAHEYIFLLSKSKKYYYDNEAIKETAKNANKTISLGEKSFSKRQAKGVGVEPSGNGKSDNYTVKEYRNKRSVWTVTTKPFKGAHFAVFPEDLIEPCILAGCPEGGIVLDPFMGSGTTAVVALKHNRNYIGIELNPEYIKIAEKRISEATSNQLAR
jgi:DNA modification methylase